MLFVYYKLTTITIKLFQSVNFHLSIQILCVQITDTTGVQTPTVYFVQKSRFVLVVCDFAIGSRASGCLFNFNFATTSDVVGSEPYNISRDAKVNSSLCAGDSNACMCLAIDRFVTSYSTIEAFTLEEDGTYSSISVPAVRRDMSENPERISVCNPPELPTEPVNPAKDKTGKWNMYKF